MKRTLDITIVDGLRHYVERLVKYLERHDPGSSANAYFCVDVDGHVLTNVGTNGFEVCQNKNENTASDDFRAACTLAGGTVKGGCISGSINRVSR